MRKLFFVFVCLVVGLSSCSMPSVPTEYTKVEETKVEKTETEKTEAEKTEAEKGNYGAGLDAIKNGYFSHPDPYGPCPWK